LHETALFSEHGISIINATPELCYPQIVSARVSEDNLLAYERSAQFRSHNLSALEQLDLCIFSNELTS
jgi:hypothetical protein